MASSDNTTRSAQGPNLEPHNILQHDFVPSQLQDDGFPASPVSQGSMRDKRRSTDYANRPQVHTSSSRNTQSSTSTRAGNRAAQRDVRTLPPWIDSYEAVEPSSNATDRLLSSPSRAHSAHHHHTPSETERRTSQDGYIDDYDDAAHGSIGKRHETGFFGGHREPVKGRKWDHARNGDPVIMKSGVLPTSSPWQTYIKSSMYGPGITEDGEKKDAHFLRQQTPGYENPWRGDLEGNEEPDTLMDLLHNKKRQKNLLQRIQHTLIMNPFVPLSFRVLILITSSAALALSGSIHHFSNTNSYPQSASTIMAIVVDTIAIPYILYITWNEYTGKPIGLRSPRSKIRLVLLDVWFIIFESANVALAFQSLTDDHGACRNGVNGFNFTICSRIKGLCAILLVALISWSFTFSVSIYRLVERVGGRVEDD